MSENAISDQSPRESRYRAFLSYSRAADGKLTPALQRALQRYAKPWLKTRAFKVFRDKTSLSMSSALWPSIENALASSEYFLLLGSPEAADSPWVQDEVKWWLDNKSVETMFIIWTGGELAYDRTLQDFDWSRTTALPESLRGQYKAEPNWVDMRWAKVETDLSIRHSDFKEAVLDIAARLHNKPKDELQSEDIVQHRRTMSAFGIGFLVIVALSVIALWQWGVASANAEEATRQRDLAVGRLLATEALSEEPVDVEGRENRALLAIEALRRFADRGEYSGEADRALRDALQLFAREKHVLPVDADPTQVRFSSSGSELTVLDAVGRLHTWRLDDPDSVVTRRYRGRDPALSADGSYLAIADGRASQWRDVSIHSTQEPENQLVPEYRTRDIIGLSGDGTLIAVNDSNVDGIRIIDVPSGSVLGRFENRFMVRFSPDGNFLSRYQGFREGTRLWRIRGTEEGTDLAPMWDNDGSLIAFSTDSRFAALRSGNSIAIIDVTRGSAVATLEFNGDLNDAGGMPVALGREAKYLAVRVDSGVEVRDIRTGYRLVLPAFSHDLAFSPDGRYLAVAMPNGYTQHRQVVVWEILSLSEAFDIAHTRPVDHLSVLSNPPTVITYTIDETDTNAWSEVRLLGEDFRKLRPDVDHGLGKGWVGDRGKALAVQHGETVRIWSVLDGMERQTLQMGQQLVHVVFEPGGRHVALDDGDRVSVVEVESGLVVSELDTPGRLIEIRMDSTDWLLFAADTRATNRNTRGERDVTDVQVWNLKTRELIATTWPAVYKPPQPKFEIRRDSQVASVVRVSDQREIASIDPGQDVGFLQLSDDGRYMAARLGTHAVRIWYLDPGDLTAIACGIVRTAGIEPDDWERLVVEEPYRATCER